MSIDGILRVLVLSIDVLPETLVMATEGLPGRQGWALVLSTSGALNDISEGNWEEPFFAPAGDLSSHSPVVLPSPINESSCRQTSG